MLGIARKNASRTNPSSWNSFMLKSSPSILQPRREMCLGVLPDGVDRSSDAFSENSQLMKDLLSQLQSSIKKVSSLIFILFNFFFPKIWLFGNLNWIVICNGCFWFKVLAGGGEESVKRNRSRKKLLPRERIEQILDPGSSLLELSQVNFRGFVVFIHNI